MEKLKVRKISIKGLLNSSSIDWELDKVNVLVGKNGTGKSTIINIIDALLRFAPNEYINRCTDCKIEFEDGRSVELKNQSENTVSYEELNELISAISSSYNTFFSRSNNKKKLKEFDGTVEQLRSLQEQLKSIGKAGDVSEARLSFGRIHRNGISENEISDNINVEFISTINMNSNSINEFKSSSGIKSTILDFEIQNEINRFLNKDSSEETCLELTNVINKFFKESNKETYFDGDNFVFQCKNGQELGFKDLSSGERQLFYILLRTANSRGKFTIFLMDEPEISLHLSWQEELINSILELNENCQIIIVTHSPAIVMNGWMDSYKDIQELIQG